MVAPRMRFGKFFGRTYEEQTHSKINREITWKIKPKWFRNEAETDAQTHQNQCQHWYRKRWRKSWQIILFNSVKTWSFIVRVIKLECFVGWVREREKVSNNFGNRWTSSSKSMLNGWQNLWLEKWCRNYGKILTSASKGTQNEDKYWKDECLTRSWNLLPKGMH